MAWASPESSTICQSRILLPFAGLVIATALVVSSCSRPNEDAEVNASVQRLVAAVNAKDINGIMAYYTPDDSLLVFDALIPRQYVGAAAF